MQITREQFEQQRRPRFGAANPERMQVPFWEWMIRGDDGPKPTEAGVLAEYGLMMRNGVLKSINGPWRARDLFKVPLNREDGPIWTFDRMGQTSTELPDGRLVCIGGEHEDYYDPDFHIYNDVVVFGSRAEIQIYGYPKDVFPPTDFHTATLVADQIFIIGCVGYADDRRPGHISPFALDIADFRISRVETIGDGPAWIFKHEAAVDKDGVITIRGGEVVEGSISDQKFRRNFEEYALDTRTGIWRRLRNKN